MKKTYLFILLFLLTQVAYSKTYYATPDGSTSNDGTSFSSPMDLLTAIEKLRKGDSLLLSSGVFNITYSSGNKNSIVLNQSATAGDEIVIIGDAQNGSTIDFQYPVGEWIQNGFGISMEGDYHYIKNITITRAGYQGVYVVGSHNTFENCVFYDNRNTGFEINKGGEYTTVINCDAYYNYDPKKNGSMADGFGPKQTQGPGNRFIGCRAWENSDDGFDLFDSPEKVIIEHCWTFDNGIDVFGIGSSFAGNGNGFKVGGNGAEGNHELYNCVSFGHPSKGFDQNNNSGGVLLYNCTGYDNDAYNFSFGGSLNSGQKNDIRNNVSYSGNVNIANATEKNNSWNLNVSISLSDFESITESYAKIERESDGTLPYVPFLVPTSSSVLIDKGVDVGLAYGGVAPDLGYYEVVDEQQNKYTLTVKTTTGGVISPSTSEYTEGTVVTVTATADEGFIFNSWSGAASGSTNSTTITLDNNKTIAANFTAINQYQVTDSIVGMGIITPSIVGEYYAGTVISTKAHAYIGYKFDSWSGDYNDSDGSSVTIEIDGDKHLMATFVETDELIIVEFEDGNFETAVADSESINSGYSGTGYVNTENVLGAWTEITVYATESGDYESTLFYAGNSDRSMVVLVNGVEQVSLYGVSTGIFTNYETEQFILPLVVGKNVLRFKATNTSGAPNLDKLEITPHDFITSTGFKPFSKEGYSVVIAPTPTKDSSKLFISSLKDDIVSIALYSNRGTLLHSENIQVDKGVTEVSIPVMVNLKKGIYFVELKVGNSKKVIEKLVKIK